MKKREIEKIKKSIFDKLPEYSCSLPTKTVIGKVWKRKKDFYNESKGWLIGEYVLPADGNRAMVGVEWREVEIIDDSINKFS